MSNKKTKRTVIARSVLVLGSLWCFGIVAYAQSPGDQQVNDARRASDAAALTRPTIPTSPVLMNGVLVDMPIAPAQSSPGNGVDPLNVPAARSAAPSAQKAPPSKPSGPQSVDEVQVPATPAGARTTVIGPSSTDEPGGMKTARGSTYVPGEPSSTDEPAAKKP